MGAAAIIACVFAQLEKLFNIKVPSLQVGADSPFAFTALVHCDRCIVHDLQERYNTL